MCTVSMIGDYYGDKWNPLKDWGRAPNLIPGPHQPFEFPVTRTEFDALRKDVLEMKELLKRAVEYDKKNNEPHCEQEEKIALLKQVAKFVGVDLSDVFKE